MMKKKSNISKSYTLISKTEYGRNIDKIQLTPKETKKYKKTHIITFWKN